MMRRYLFPCALALMALALACSRYSSLNKEIEQYRPPVYAISSTSRVRAPAGLSEPNEFTLEKKKISEIEARWEKDLKTPRSETSFFVPPPNLINALEPAIQNARTASKALLPRFSLETLETLTYLRNPGIRAGENKVRAALDTFTQVMALDDILREYTAFTEGLMTGVGPSVGKEPMRTKFPFPGILSLKGEIVNQTVKEAMEALEIARRDAITQARKAFWNFLFVWKAEKIARETIALYRHLERVATIRYETGGTSYQDAIKVRIRRKILEEDLDTLLQREKNLQAEILEIVNLSPEVGIGLPENRLPSTIIPPLDGLYPLARERRQELRRMRARVGKMERLIELARTRILPSYSLNFSLYEDEAITQVGSLAVKSDFPISTTASRGAGLPLMPWYGVEDAYLRQTRQELKALRNELEKEEAHTNTLVRDAWFRLDLANREETLYRKSILQLSRDALDVSTRGYEAGNVSFADVISSYNAWLDVTLSAEREVSNLGIARAQLENTVGATLPSERKEAIR